MKRPILLLVTAFFFCLINLPAQEKSPVKHSLVVAISNYSPNSGFRHIDADNDLRIITTLLDQQGFTDTIVLRDSRATKEGFIKAFSRLQSSVHPGDIVYIHFSTHGQQIEDLSKDEADSLDEAIALYDAKASGDDKYNGQNHLTDDEFGTMIEALRRVLGKKGDILVMIDACHSGSMSRGLDTAIIRGGYPPIQVNSGNSNNVTRGDNPSLRGASGNSKRQEDHKPVGMFSTLNQSKGDLANYVVFSACENDEVSSEFYYDHHYFGPLTWAFLNSLLSNNSENYTYNKLFHDIQYEMVSMFENYKTRQNPTIEAAQADGLDKIIFGGKNVRQQPFFTITKFLAPNKVLIKGGNLSGIFDSTTVVVFPAGTPTIKGAGSPITTGTITSAGYMESIVQLSSNLDPRRAGDYWLFPSERKLGGYKVRLNLGAFSSNNLKKKVLADLEDFRFVEISADTPSYYLEQKKGPGEILVLEHGRSRKPYKDNINPDDLKDVLLNVAQARFLKCLQTSVPGIDLDISFVPVDSHRQAKTNFIDPHTMRYTFREGKDSAMLVIANTGKTSIYFNVIDIDPEDNFNVIFPSIGFSSSECMLKPGERFKSAAFTFNKPYGTETIKVIASPQKFDLRPVLNQKSQTRSISGDIENLFISTNGMRGSPSLPESTQLSTFNFFFDVIKQ